MSAATVETGLKVVRVGLLGLGGVGQAVVRGATSASGRLGDAGVLLKCVAGLVKDEYKPRVAPPIPLVTDASAFPFESCDVVVEVLGGIEPARTLVAESLRRGIPVVTANKSLVAAHGLALLEIADAHQATFYFEAAVMAGVPCVNTLARRPLASGTGAFAGIVNGTSHYILSKLASGATFEGALSDAVERGYAEPSSEADISGRDAAEKLTILLHLAGPTGVRTSDLPTRRIDDLEPWHCELARRLGGSLKPVAVARTTGRRPGAWVGPAFVPSGHPFAALNGVANVLTVGTGAGAVTFTGPGAGPDVTAATILDDIVEVIAGRRATLRRPVVAREADSLTRVPESAWFLALDDVRSRAGQIAEFLAARHLPGVFIVEDGSRLGVITVESPVATVLDAVDSLAANGVAATWMPVFDGAAHV